MIRFRSGRGYRRSVDFSDFCRMQRSAHSAAPDKHAVCIFRSRFQK
jgi:hypothetical protein